jgi:SM-20-related protein
LQSPGLTPAPDDHLLFGQIAADLVAKGYSIQPSAVPLPVLHCLNRYLETVETSSFLQARVGRSQETVRNQFVRSNKVSWIEETEAATQPWRVWAEGLQNYLNRHLFLGLASFESHFTLYEQGDFYKRHLDVFKGCRNRVVSMVTYLNEGWLPDQGGELVLYPPAGASVKVTPAQGTLVLFMSEEIPHEVLVTGRRRYGVAGWFRVDEPGLEMLLR